MSTEIKKPAAGDDRGRIYRLKTIVRHIEDYYIARRWKLTASYIECIIVHASNQGQDYFIIYPYLEERERNKMMKAMMKAMMPMMSGSMEKMSFSEKNEMMDKMMPHMMANLTFEEKTQLMEKMMPLMMGDMTFEQKMQMMMKMMPLMMKDIDMNQMDGMMDTMMPTMMNKMQDSGMDMLSMMRMMCPKCVSVATAQATPEDKVKLKNQMSEVFAKL